MTKPQDKVGTPDEVIKLLVKVAKKLKIHPMKLEKSVILRETSITDWTLRKFGGLSYLLDEASKFFDDEPTHPLQTFTREGMGNIIKRYNLKEGIFFITSASPTTEIDYTDKQRDMALMGKPFQASNVHKKGLQAIENYCDRRGAELVILPMRAHVRALKSQPLHYDPILQPHIDNFATEIVFNKHVKAMDVYLNPQQVNPLTGLHRIRGKSDKILAEDQKLENASRRFKTSIIVAHSKQHMKVYATGNSTHPRILHSTGAITVASYLRNRIGMIAEEDHVLGGLILEIKGSKFFVRQVQIDENTGSFVDLGTRFHADGRATKERAEAFKMGDIHPGFEDKEVLDIWAKVWKLTNPKRIFFEDFFDGQSISHHMEKNKIKKALKPKHFKTLKDEIEMAKGVLYSVIDKAPKDTEIVATASNHPGHVHRYLEEGRYLDDPANFEIATRMVNLVLDGHNPLQKMLDPSGRMKWLGVNDDYFVEGVQCGAHGHLGVNGSNPGPVGLEAIYGDAMTAHTHTPGIIHDLYTVGHSTVARHGYNTGPSTWIPCSGLVYKGGHKQLVMVIQGDWRLEKKGDVL